MNPNYEALLPKKETPTFFENVILHKTCRRCSGPFDTYFRSKKRCDVCQPLAVRESHQRAMKKQQQKRKVPRDGKIAAVLKTDGSRDERDGGSTPRPSAKLERCS